MNKAKWNPTLVLPACDIQFDKTSYREIRNLHIVLGLLIAAAKTMKNDPAACVDTQDAFVSALNRFSDYNFNDLNYEALRAIADIVGQIDFLLID